MSDSKIGDLIEPLLAKLDLELDDLKVVSAGKRRMVQVRIDGEGPAGRGPDLDQIAAATRQISQALDDTDAMGDSPYTLEVSSRGVSTPLTEAKHFRRNIDRLVRLTRSDGDTIFGRIIAVADDHVTVQPEPEPGTKPTKKQTVAEPVDVDFAQLSKAIVQIEMNRKDADQTLDPDADFDEFDDELEADEDEE